MNACCCSNPYCRKHGCMVQKDQAVNFENGYPTGFGVTYPIPQQGCICPPTSEQTCMNEYCPRKSKAKDLYK